MKPWLKAWVLSSYNKTEPVFFPKQDKINSILADVLQKPPFKHKPKPYNREDLQIVLPYYEHPNTNVFNYLSKTSELIIEDWINQQFMVCFIKAMNRGAVLGIPISLAITSFMEKYKLTMHDNDGKLHDMLRKSIYRRHSLNSLWGKRPYRKRQNI